MEEKSKFVKLKPNANGGQGVTRKIKLPQDPGEMLDLKFVVKKEFRSRKLHLTIYDMNNAVAGFIHSNRKRIKIANIPKEIDDQVAQSNIAVEFVFEDDIEGGNDVEQE